jgi:hypothetical protein
VLLVLASRSDRGAATLASGWAAQDAQLITPASLSQPGWVWNRRSAKDSFLAVEGGRHPIRAVTGVVSFMPVVDPGELDHIVVDDRTYIASEMTAFLVAWLSWLSDEGIPVLNRPTPFSLTGPALHPEQWLQAAARAGLPIEPAHRRVSPGPGLVAEPVPAAILAYPVIDGACLPASDGTRLPEALRDGVCRLADAVGASMLTAAFVESEGALRFSGGFPTVDGSRAEVADAIASLIARTLAQRR